MENDTNQQQQWNLLKLFQKISNPSKTIEFCVEMGLLPGSRFCRTHGQAMILDSEDKIGLFICNSKHKRHKISRGDNTWFKFCHTSPEVCLIITYCFAKKYNIEDAIRESSIGDSVVSSSIVTDRFSFAREVCMLSLDRNYVEQDPIGGLGKKVEVIEIKIGKRNYERGRIKEGSWILAFIERGTKEFRLEICPDNSRDKTTFTNLIKKNILPGTEVFTDCWIDIDLKNHDYNIHKTVNHNKNNVNPDSDTHRQNNESCWKFLRQRLKRGDIDQENLDLHFCEYLWRLKIKNKDSFICLLDDIKRVYSGVQG